MAAIKPYKISISEHEIKRLTQKLATTTLPDELEEPGWDYGCPLNDVKRLLTFWKDKYSWRDAESKINRLPQYMTSIPMRDFGHLEVHFVHQQSTVKPAIPLLFCHGWPGSFLEVSKILDLLTLSNKEGPAFHVVAPSLPNFGFSAPVEKRGFGLAQYAEVCHNLMIVLGYTEYVTQGGDWGSMITRTMGRIYPHNCRASHLNMFMGAPPRWRTHPLLALQHAINPYTPQELAGFQRTASIRQSGLGYFHIQSSKPQTIGYSLADSPVGLMAWIFEKLHDWTDDYAWTEEEVLTWVSIYWFSTAGPAASVRIYYETTHTKEHVLGPETWNPHVKMGLSFFPKDIARFPRLWGRTLGPVVYEKEYESGGHFAAWERPVELAEDLKRMFSRGGGAYGVVGGSDGYA